MSAALAFFSIAIALTLGVAVSESAYRPKTERAQWQGMEAGDFLAIMGIVSAVSFIALLVGWR
jgi:hypothetical protein